MKKFFKFWAACAALFLCQAVGVCDSGHIQTITAFPVGPSGYVAASSTVSLKTDAINWATAELVVTSATIGAATFTDGSKSSATITVTSAPVGGFVYPGQICIAGVCATYQIGLVPTATGQYTYPYDANGVSSNTAQGICNWILGNNQLQGEVTCSCPAGQSVIYTTSTAQGSSANYPVFSSSATQVGFGAGKIGSGFMTGGSSSSYVYQGNTIALPTASNYATGLGVYLSTSSPAQPIFYSTASVGGTATAFQTGTTFYVIYANSGNLEFATSQANAVAGNYITFVSSNGAVSANTFTLNVPVIAGTPVLKWVVSNDDMNWVPFITSTFGQTVQVPPVLSTYYSTGAVTASDLGRMDYGWLGLGITAPTSGEIQIQSTVVGNAP